MPLAHVQPPSDLDIREPVGGIQDELGALHIPIRRLL
jgi:hypothetical protein